MSCITDRLDKVAGELEKVDPCLALALDHVSDRLERYGTVKDFIDVKMHKKDLEKYPTMYHSMDTIEKVKKALKNPEMEKKIEEYLKKEHAVEIIECHVTGHGFDKNMVALTMKFKSVDGIDTKFFTEHKFKQIYAEEYNVFSTNVYVPLSIFEETK